MDIKQIVNSKGGPKGAAAVAAANGAAQVCECFHLTLHIPKELGFEALIPNIIDTLSMALAYPCDFQAWKID